MIRSEIICRSIDYILQHLDEEIRIEDVAEHCNYSKYYFSRMFKSETGESVYSFIKRLKMEQSAFRLKTEKEKSITDIGVVYGYTPSNYSTVFKQHHSMSPAEFRKSVSTELLVHPFHPDQIDRLKSVEEYNQRVMFRQLDDIYVIYERYIGNYTDFEKNWYEFTQRYQSYLTENSLLIVRSYDDPTITGTEQCMYDVCMTIDPGCSLENVTTIPGGKFAVYHYEGYIDNIFYAYQGVMNIWMGHNSYELDDKRCVYEVYRSIDCENRYVIMDICIPVK
jgi:AraC family transcriptional regulator